MTSSAKPAARMMPSDSGSTLARSHSTPAVSHITPTAITVTAIQ